MFYLVHHPGSGRHMSFEGCKRQIYLFPHANPLLSPFIIPCHVTGSSTAPGWPAGRTVLALHAW
jgi:hypothetical protein